MAGASAGGRARPAAAGGALLDAIERRLGVTVIGLAAVGLAAAGAVVARAAHSSGIMLLAYGVVLVLALAWALGRRPPAVVAERRSLPTRVRAGRTVTVELEVSALRRVTTLILEEGLDDQLGEAVRIPLPVLGGGEVVTHSYSFTPRLRGVRSVGPLVAEWNDPFGLTRRRVVLCPARQLIVHPAVEPVAVRVTNREWQEPPVRPPVLKPWPTGFELYGLREYVHGDDPRRIVWRAVAQHGKYMVRESEQGITDRVNILLDTDQDLHSPGEPSETFENAVRTAASLAVKHLEDGFAVTLEINSTCLVHSARGRGRIVPVLDTLAAVRTERAPLTRSLQRLFFDQHRNAHNILVTPHLDPEAAARVRVLRERGVSLLLVLVLWDDTDPATIHRATTLGCSVVEVSTGVLLQNLFRNVVRARI